MMNKLDFDDKLEQDEFEGVDEDEWVRLYLFNLLTPPSRHLLAQSQQQKHQNNVWNLFKVNHKDTRATSITSF